LDLSGSWYKPRQYEARDITMSDYEKQRRNLPPEIGNLVRLETLDLRGNGLTKLPVEISKLKKLKNLILYGNDFTVEEKEKIKRWLPNCQIEF